MKKTKEQLELLVVMQKHKIKELTLIKRRVYIRQNVDMALIDYFTKKIAKAKMKLNHYKQLLGNFKANKRKFKVGDRVCIVGRPLATRVTKYIGLTGEVRVVTAAGNYKVRTEIDKEGDDTAWGVLYNFPLEALELAL